MIRLGLTGSIGMGKSTTAKMFADCGDAVIDADAIVHALYAGPAVDAVEAAFPGTARDGAIDRKALSAAVLGDPAALKRLEAIVHPMVREEQARALEKAQESGARIAVIDVPLLFETGRDEEMDAIAVVSAPASVQKVRVITRPGMTAEKFEAIRAKQMPDADKRRRAHFIIDTAHGLAATRAEVGAVRRALLQFG
ncbi:dephospho-CoA kinase [Acuticoccus sp. MNP-M23]|uniref:dephospho-CoA kinase n=1 Tax=Acuticoccus sp. MNP-M23 TaxID=3072793 RepID=UPI00281562BC|nr:dephospho-CoA kinase [Acuticoccus sp. MNP-M23]WMS44280.1 dephospho-CoA kinase [Acuticoccus sp. MNP-M23]